MLTNAQIMELDADLTRKLEEVRVREPIMQFFAFDHLPLPLREVSKKFAALAYVTYDSVPRNPERTVALRKLLESKDAAVRAVLFKQPE